MGFRFAILIIILLFSTAFLLFHFYQVQIVKGAYYLVRAESQLFSGDLLKSDRGVIYFSDKNGNFLAAAVNKDYPTIFAVPEKIPDIKETANQLASLLNYSPQSLEKNFSKNNRYLLLERKADENTIQKIGDLNIQGIYESLEPERFYPFGPLASQVLGFVGYGEDQLNPVGKYGIEKAYDALLSGVPGKLEGDKIVSPKEGENLILTIDPTIQNESESVLNDLVENYKATGGTIIVSDPQAGKILAMANLPNFDPNDYSKSSLKDLLNPAVQEIYEPGSVFKPITMAIGIEAGKITPETTFYDTGKAVFNNHEIKNWDLKAYGKVTMTQVIENSINTGAVFAERQIGRKIFKQYLFNFDLDKKTGIDLPGELTADLKGLGDKAPDINFATASFGQGIALTSIKLVQIMSAIANQGKLMMPYLNSDLGPKELGEIMSGQTAEEVTQMMISAVDKAKVATIPGYSLAGKTGTAQVPDNVNGGYLDKYIDTYIGFGPTSNPRFLILIKLNEPAGNPVAALTVVPAFKNLAQFLINYLNISPDRING